MNNKFEVSILSARQVHSLPGIWPPEMLRALLTLVEWDDVDQIDEKDLLDMAIMAIQDLGVQLAGERVLEVVFGDTMRPGVRQNLVDDLQQDEPWEDFANVSQQRGLFVAVVMLQQAFPGRFAVPDALSLHFTVRGPGGDDELREHVSNPVWLVRLLARGMPETAPLLRLYEAEIISGPFPDAAGLIWHCDVHDAIFDQAANASTVAVDLIAPNMWFESLTRGLVFDA
jgi:hypothetical protein